MRIAVDCRNLQEPQPSGVSWYTFYMLRALVENSPEHEFVLCVLKEDKKKKTELYQLARTFLSGDRVQWRVIPYPKRLVTFLMFFGFWRSWKRFFGQCDIIWLPNLHFVPRSRSTCPYVLTMHDLSFERYPHYLPIKGRVWHNSMRPLIRSANALACVSTSTLYELRAVYGDTVALKARVVYPGVQAAVTTRALEEVPTVVCVSTVEPRKNIDALISAIELVRQRIPNTRCVIIGKVGFASTQTYARMKAAQIMYFGYSTEEQKNFWYDHAHVMVYPSIYEGFGLPPLEAQARGLPVIAGNHTALPEVLGESAILCDMHDVRSIARSIESVLTETDLAQELQKRGFENARRFTWERSALQLKSMLESLI